MWRVSIVMKAHFLFLLNRLVSKRRCKRDNSFVIVKIHKFLEAIEMLYNQELAYEKKCQIHRLELKANRRELFALLY